MLALQALSIVWDHWIRDDRELFQHKILLNIAAFEDNCDILEEIRVNRCIYNKMIIVSDMKQMATRNYILNKYIIYAEDDALVDTLHNVYENYDTIYDKIYTNFDKELTDIRDMFTRHLLTSLEQYWLLVTCPQDAV